MVCRVGILLNPLSNKEKSMKIGADDASANKYVEKDAGDAVPDCIFVFAACRNNRNNHTQS